MCCNTRGKELRRLKRRYLVHLGEGAIGRLFGCICKLRVKDGQLFIRVMYICTYGRTLWQSTMATCAIITSTSTWWPKRLLVKGTPQARATIIRPAVTTHHRRSGFNQRRTPVPNVTSNGILTVHCFPHPGLPLRSRNLRCTRRPRRILPKRLIPSRHPSSLLSPFPPTAWLLDRRYLNDLLPGSIISRQKGPI